MSLRNVEIVRAMNECARGENFPLFPLVALARGKRPVVGQHQHPKEMSY
jgi:hypothetical protein